MARAIDGTVVADALPTMACGGTPLFDVDSGISYRCDTCFAVIGSIGQSSRCVEMNKAASEAVRPNKGGNRHAF